MILASKPYRFGIFSKYVKREIRAKTSQNKVRFFSDDSIEIATIPRFCAESRNDGQVYGLLDLSRLVMNA